MASPSAIVGDIQCRPGFLLKRCHQVVVAVFLAECREFTITPSQYACLQVLSACPRIDQLTLGRLVGLDRSTVGLVVRILTKRGLIERAVDRHDKRKLCLQLSRDGMRLLKAAAPAAARVSKRLLGVLPRAARDQFVALMQDFLHAHRAVIDVAAVLAGSESGNGRCAPATLRPRRQAASAKRTLRRR